MSLARRVVQRFIEASSPDVLGDIEVLRVALGKFREKWESYVSEQQEQGKEAVPPGWPGKMRADTAVHGWGANTAHALRMLGKMVKRNRLTPQIAQTYEQHTLKHPDGDPRLMFQWIDRDLRTRTLPAFDRVAEHIRQVARG